MKSTTIHQPVALITGAAKRLGAELAKALHAKQYNIIIHYRSSDQQAAALAAELNNHRPHSAICLAADFNQIDLIDSFMKKVIAAWGRLDVLFNNASEYFATPMGQTTADQWQSLINSNLSAAFFLSQSAQPWLAQTKGTIINMSDINATHPKTDYSVYCIAKAGVNMLTKVLAKEFSPDIRVNAVALTTTLWQEGDKEQSPQLKQAIIEQSLVKRKAEPQDLIHTIHFLIDNTFINGQIITIDGGTSLHVTGQLNRNLQ